MTTIYFRYLVHYQYNLTKNEFSLFGRMLMQSGVGNSTAWPPGITQCLQGKGYTLYKYTFSISTYIILCTFLEDSHFKCKLFSYFLCYFWWNFYRFLEVFFVSSLFSIFDSLFIFFLSKYFSLIILFFSVIIISQYLT